MKHRMKGKIVIVNKRKSNRERLLATYPNAYIFDVTSDSQDKMGQFFSPYYPHGNVPVPFSEGITAHSVEGIWQGLKFLKGFGIDVSFLSKEIGGKMKRKGVVLGHQKGLNSSELLGYYYARFLIYLPSYYWVLTEVESNRRILKRMSDLLEVGRDFVLLDYNTNLDIDDTSKPLSHAGLIKLYLEEEEYPLLATNDDVEKRLNDLRENMDKLFDDLLKKGREEVLFESSKTYSRGEYIAFLRKSVLKMSQKDMSKRFDISVETISSIETDKNVSPKKVIDLYSKLLLVLRD